MAGRVWAAPGWTDLLPVACTFIVAPTHRYYRWSSSSRRGRATPRRSPPAGPPSPGTRRACLPHHRRSRRGDGGGRGQDDTLADNRRHAPGSPSFHPTCPADLPSRDLPIEVAFTFAGAASAGQSGPPTTTASPASSPLLQLPLDARAEDGAGHHRDSVSRILRPPPRRALHRPTRPSRQGIRTGDLVKREHFLYGEALFLPATPKSNTHTGSIGSVLRSSASNAVDANNDRRCLSWAWYPRP